METSLRSVNLFDGGVADKHCQKYSGGMKRRLSVAISLIGNPQVIGLHSFQVSWSSSPILLANCSSFVWMHSNPSSEVFRCTLQVVYMDEPSTGLDPASRYNLWNVVKQSKQNRAIILTSMVPNSIFCGFANVSIIPADWIRGASQTHYLVHDLTFPLSIQNWSSQACLIRILS